jgi:hypothetical protein
MYSEKEWQDFLRNPFTKRLALVAREQPHKKLFTFIEFEEYLSIALCYSQCMSAERSHAYDYMQGYIEHFSNFLEMNSPKSPLMCITYFLGEFIRTNDLFKGDELPQFIHMVCANPFIASCLLDRDQTDLILYALVLEQAHIEFLNETRADRIMDLLAQKFYSLRKESRQRIKERMDLIKEELMAAAWHPRRIEKWLEECGWDAIESM